MTGYQTGPGNQLLNDGLWTYTFDSEGNLIKKSKGSSLETWQYGYDNLNHLVWAKDEPSDGGSPTLIATYIYDTFGNRIEKDVWTSAGGTVISRIGYDNAEPPALAGGLANAWVDLNGSNQLVTRYIQEDQAGPPLARISAAGVAGWYLPDHLGSIRNLADNTGTLIDTISYDAYGKLSSESNPSNGDQYRWADLQYDSATALNFAQARQEDPATGRWLEQDPLGFSAGDSNFYRYVFNVPVSHVDVSGLEEMADAELLYFYIEYKEKKYDLMGERKINISNLIGKKITIYAAISVLNPARNKYYHTILLDIYSTHHAGVHPEAVGVWGARDANSFKQGSIYLAPGKQDFIRLSTDDYELNGNYVHWFHVHAIDHSMIAEIRAKVVAGVIAGPKGGGKKPGK